SSNLDDNSRASVICEFDTIAMVTVSPDAPNVPAPAHPPTVRHTVAARANTARIGFRFTSYLFLCMSQKPPGTVEVAHEIAGEPTGEGAEGGAMLARPPSERDRRRTPAHTLQRPRHRAVLQIGVAHRTVGCEEAPADLTDRTQRHEFLDHSAVEIAALKQ